MGQRFLKPEEAKEYQEFLDSYHPSAQVVYDFARSRFGTLDGPTGAGKDTLRNALIAAYPAVYKKILSTTSRPLRPGETDGVEYRFRDLQYIDTGLRERRFLQAEMIHNQQVSGLDFGDIAVMDSEHFGIGILNVDSVKKMRLLNDGIKTIFIVPPSHEELLRRMNQGSRSMKEDEVKRRLVAAKQELATALEDSAYCLLTNDELVRSVEKAHAYYQTGERDKVEEESTKQIMREILNTLSNYS